MLYVVISGEDSGLPLLLSGGGAPGGWQGKIDKDLRKSETKGYR